MACLDTEQSQKDGCIFNFMLASFNCRLRLTELVHQRSVLMAGLDPEESLKRTAAFFNFMLASTPYLPQEKD